MAERDAKRQKTDKNTNNTTLEEATVACRPEDAIVVPE